MHLEEVHPGRSGRPNRSRVKAIRLGDKVRGVDDVEPRRPIVSCPLVDNPIACNVAWPFFGLDILISWTFRVDWTQAYRDNIASMSARPP